jgi:hypothetical protein
MLNCDGINWIESSSYHCSMSFFLLPLMRGIYHYLFLTFRAYHKALEKELVLMKQGDIGAESCACERMDANKCAL